MAEHGEKLIFREIRACFFLQLLVGLLQFLLTFLQFGREGLRLREKIFRPGIGFNGVKHDADTLSQLLEKSLVSRIETIERGKLHHRFYLSFEQYWKDDNIHWLRFAQTRADFNVVGGHVRQENASTFERRLPDHSLAEFEMSFDSVAIATCIACEKLELRLLIRAIHNIQDTLLRRNQRGQLGQDQFAHRQQISLALQ